MRIIYRIIYRSGARITWRRILGRGEYRVRRVATESGISALVEIRRETGNIRVSWRYLEVNREYPRSWKYRENRQYPRSRSQREN